MAGIMEQLDTLLSSIKLQDWTIENSFSELFKSNLNSINIKLFEEWAQDGYNINHLFKTDNQCDSYESLLTLSAKVGASAAVIKLLDEGADINLRNSNGCTPLHCGSQCGHLRVVEILLDKGADINVPIKKGCTPLYLAACEGHLEIVELLVKKGANLDVSTNEGLTPLFAAVSKDHIEVVSSLIGYGCAVDKPNCNKTTPLIEASKRNAKICELLINAGGDMYAVNKFGRGPLHVAVLNNSLEIIKLLIDKGIDVKKKCEIQGLTSLDYAIKRGHLGIVRFLIDEMKMELTDRIPLSIVCLKANLPLLKYLVEEKKMNCCVPDKNGLSTLHAIVLNDNSTVDLIKYLVSNGADVNARDEHGATLLYCASVRGKLDLVRFLIEETCVDINIEDNDGNTPLVGGVLGGNLELVKYLLSKGAKCSNKLDVASNIGINENDVDFMNYKNGRTLLHYACEGGNFDLIKYLVVDKKMDCNICDNNGWTPLLEAIRSECQIDVIKFLINNGADINVSTKQGTTALQLACKIGNLNVVKFFIEGRYINRKSRILFCAIIGGNLEVVRYATHITSDDLIDEGGPLYLAALFGHLDIVKYYAEEKHMGINDFNVKGYTPLYGAAMGNSLETVKYFVEEKYVDFITPDEEEGWTPLYLSAHCSKNIEIAKYLIEKGADVEVTTIKGRTPVQGACVSGNLVLLKYLVEEKNVSLTHKDIYGHSALDAAVESGQFHIAKYLIEERGVELNSLDINGRSILELAVHSGNLDMVRYLIKDKHLTKYLNFKSQDKLRTPLHIAAMWGHKEVAEFLLDNGAILDSLDVHKNSPLQLAVHKGHSEVIEFLQNRGARLVRNHYNHISSGRGFKTDPHIDNKTFVRRNNGLDDINLWEKSALYSAVFNGEINEVKRLIEEVSDNDKKYCSHALGLSIKRGHLDITKYLINENSANVNFKDKNGKSVLHLAVQSGNIEMVKYLVDEKNLKQLINSRCDERQTPLHVATSFKETIIVDYLLTKGAIVNSFDKRGNTCLHIAATEGYLEGVMLFINKGSKVNAKNNQGLTPLECAQEYNQVGVIQFIKQKTNP